MFFWLFVSSFNGKRIRNSEDEDEAGDEENKELTGLMRLGTAWLVLASEEAVK